MEKAIANMIIRPKRNKYEPLDETEIKKIKGQNYKMISFEVKNELGNMLSCTFAEPANEKDRSTDCMPCVVYAHGATENKLEGLEQMELVLPLGINLCCFDFSGCGNSEGEYVTFGHKEKNDLKQIIAHIIKY